MQPNVASLGAVPNIQISESVNMRGGPIGDQQAMIRAATGGGPVPVRRPLSVRRTTSIDIAWPDGRDAPLQIVGSSRDAVTDAGKRLQILNEDRVDARATSARTILSLNSSRSDDLSGLTGCRAGGELRSRLRTLYPDQDSQRSAHYLLLDDLAGATLVANWAWFCWDDDIDKVAREVSAMGIGGNSGDMRGVCIGFAPGSTSHDEHGHVRMDQQSSAPVTSLVHPDDPAGWQPLPHRLEPATRRARWIDLFGDGSQLLVEGGFQDSANTRNGARRAIHEYRFSMRVERGTGMIASLVATPHILPHFECPAAVGNIGRLVGRNVADLRAAVPELLARTEGCTHLNDVLRALVCVPALAAQLPTREA